MVEWKAVLDALQQIGGTPMLLVFAGVFVMGYMLKNHSPLNNKLIPWVLLAFGIILALLFLGFSSVNVVLGMVIAWLTMAFYEQIKNTIEYLVTRKGEPDGR